MKMFLLNGISLPRFILTSLSARLVCLTFYPTPLESSIWTVMERELLKMGHAIYREEA